MPQNASEPIPSEEIRDWIERLELIPHPEGGWYRETWRSDVVLAREALTPGYPGDRRVMTSIHYLLATGMKSRWHRVRSEELWMHHRGDDLCLGLSKGHAAPDRPERELILGQGRSTLFQAAVSPNEWQEAEALPGEAGYALVGCVVAPGFEFEDFEMP